MATNFPPQRDKVFIRTHAERLVSQPSGLYTLSVCIFGAGLVAFGYAARTDLDKLRARMGANPPAVANPIDQHIGRRIRERRRALGMNQATLASALGLTFQQVQKYEHGFNHVSVCRLYEIAGILNVAVGNFFDGLPSTTDKAAKACAQEHQPALAGLLATRDGVVVAEFFPLIESPSLRRAMAELVRATVRANESPEAPCIEPPPTASDPTATADLAGSISPAPACSGKDQMEQPAAPPRA
jgi:transcriptional regulator with XRE-family HTH domain